MHEYDPADLVSACADFMGSDALDRRLQTLVIHTVDHFLASKDLHRRWDMIDLRALAPLLRGTEAELTRFWLSLTGVFVYMAQAGLLRRSRVRRYLEIMLEVAPTRPSLLAIVRAALAAVQDLPLH